MKKKKLGLVAPDLLVRAFKTFNVLFAQIRNAILEVKNATGLDEISDCKKLVGYDKKYEEKLRKKKHLAMMW